MSLFGGVSKAVKKVGTKANKLVSSKAVSTAMPLLSIYTRQGRQALAGGVWGKAAQYGAGLYGGAAGSAVAGAVVASQVKQADPSPANTYVPPSFGEPAPAYVDGGSSWVDELERVGPWIAAGGAALLAGVVGYVLWRNR